MTCYMRHIGWLFDATGIDDDQDGRRRLDSQLRQYFGLDPSAHCPDVWARVKALDDEGRAELVAATARALGS